MPKPAPTSPRHPARAAESAASRAFRRRHFSEASAANWRDWTWQMRQALRRPEQFARLLDLGADEGAALARGGAHLPVSVTPYYASLLAPDDPADPLRRTMLPGLAEFTVAPGELIDPLGEEPHRPVPAIVHRYPDRALFLVTDRCPVYCRYCTRSRLVGGGDGARLDWEEGLHYLATTPAVRDVLISGGDPLICSDQRLGWLLDRLGAIPHLEMIRIGTKVPVVLPQRLTPGLAKVLRRHRPLYLSLHVTHPRELTPEFALACRRLLDAGAVMGSQTVLLRGVNDSLATLSELFQGLLRLGVRPYYLLQGDVIAGSAHFRTPVARGLELLRGLRGHTSGYALPHFIVDLPGGGGKVALVPDQLEGRRGDDLVFTNYQGLPGWHYPDPPG